MQGTVHNGQDIFSYKDNLKISHAVKVGNVVHISGQVAVDPKGEVVGKGNVEKQAEYVWSNIEKVLASAGAALNDIVKIFQFVVGAENFPGMGSVRKQVFNREPFPCSTGIVVEGLVFADLLLEVDVIAVTGDVPRTGGRPGTPINLDGLFSYKEKLNISHALKVGSTLYMSGLVAFDPQGYVVGKGDLARQSEYIWENIAKIHKAAGMGPKNVVKIFQFHAGQGYAPARPPRLTYLGDHLAPVTAVSVPALAHPDLLLEVDVLAESV